MVLCEENFKPWLPASGPLAIPKLNLVIPLNFSSEQFSYNFYKLVYSYVQDERYGKHGGMFLISVARKRLNLKPVDLRASLLRMLSFIECFLYAKHCVF